MIGDYYLAESTTLIMAAVGILHVTTILGVFAEKVIVTGSRKSSKINVANDGTLE